MNEVMNAILNRRSVRKFTNQPIPEDVLKDIADAALHAPSGQGKKSWKFTIVTNQDAIKKLARIVGAQLGTTFYNMYEPAALFIPSNLKDNPHGVEDNACAQLNAQLAAYSHGVGSVWINQLRDLNDNASVRAVLTELGIPENHNVYGITALGYPDPEADKPVYKEGGEVAYVK